MLIIYPAQAQEHAPTGMLLGPLGLNAVPNARMDETGTARAGMSVPDPYMHAFLGVQLADPLYMCNCARPPKSQTSMKPNGLPPPPDLQKPEACGQKITAF